MADVVLAHHWRDSDGNDHLPGERLSVSDEEATTLVQAGYASPATASDAKQLPTDVEPASKKK